MLEGDSALLSKHHFSDSHEGPYADPPAQSGLDAFNTVVYFERWLEDVKQNSDRPFGESGFGEEIYFESGRGSKCEVTFEGVLHFDGYTVGNIKSPEGTLVLAKEGRVEADIDVGKAVISGSVTGNINAPEGVILDSDARVAGQIHTRMLSVRVGALFEGDCVFSAGARTSDIEESPGVEWLDKR